MIILRGEILIEGMDPFFRPAYKTDLEQRRIFRTSLGVSTNASLSFPTAHLLTQLDGMPLELAFDFLEGIKDPLKTVVLSYCLKLL